MIIKSIELNNFRQFIGKQKINFSTDPKKKVTLVLAENTSGKTTLLESFQWILYGKTNLLTIVNNYIKEQMQPGQLSIVEGKIVLEHGGQQYTISRSMQFEKLKKSISEHDSKISIERKESNGISVKLYGSDAKKAIANIVPIDLFPYFFFKGENIEKIGREINKGKSGNNGEFVKAIKGMLGFNWLYATREHLIGLVTNYNTEYSYNNDKKLKEIIDSVTKATNQITKNNTELDNISKDIEYYQTKRDELNEIISASKDASEKQDKCKKLTVELTSRNQQILSEKRKIFTDFSERSAEYFAIPLIEKAFEILKETENSAEGIPGMEVKSIDYLLKLKKCICGNEICEGTKEYNNLVEVKKILPPNNLGYEIKTFKSKSLDYLKHGNLYYSDFIKSKKTLENNVNYYNSRIQELNQLNTEVQNIQDVSQAKTTEIEYSNKIVTLFERQGQVKRDIEYQKAIIDNSEKEQKNYKIIDEKNKRIALLTSYCKVLTDKIENYCKKEEKIKRQELENAINDIFKEIFDFDIRICLSDSYDITLKSDNESDLDDFESSTSQDGIMAFSFIGGVIKLAKEKVSNKGTENQVIDDDIENELVSEPYPLVMDAPSSSFDTTRIKNFCLIMPTIAEQIIIFIKDTDGNYVKDYLSDIIGEEYYMDKESKYITYLKKERE